MLVFIVKENGFYKKFIEKEPQDYKQGIEEAFAELEKINPEMNASVVAEVYDFDTHAYQKTEPYELGMYGIEKGGYDEKRFEKAVEEIIKYEQNNCYVKAYIKNPSIACVWKTLATIYGKNAKECIEKLYETLSADTVCKCSLYYIHRAIQCEYDSKREFTWQFQNKAAAEKFLKKAPSIRPEMEIVWKDRRLAAGKPEKKDGLFKYDVSGKDVYYNWGDSTIENMAAKKDSGIQLLERSERMKNVLGEFGFGRMYEGKYHNTKTNKDVLFYEFVIILAGDDGTVERLYCEEPLTDDEIVEAITYFTAPWKKKY